MRALFGPLALQRCYLNIRGLNFEHAGGSVFCRGIVRGALNVKDRSAFWQKRSELAALDPANFDVVRTDRKDGRLLEGSQLGDVSGLTVQNGPADSCVDCGTRDLRQRGGAYRFE